MLDFKEQGNALYKEGDYLKAAAAYTKGLKSDPNNHVLYSNRSAALLKLNKLAKALADAEECVKLDPSYHKGWMRKAMVLESQGQLQQALESFQKAHEAAGGSNADYAARIKTLKHKTGSQQKIAKITKSAAEQAALAYANAKLAYVRERIQELGNKFPPELHILHPKVDSSRSSKGGSSSSSSKASSPDGEEDEEAEAAPRTHPGMWEIMVRAQACFDAPDVLSMFVGEMRQQAQDLQAAAVTLVAPKAAVSFPQTWRQPSWQYGSHDGVFVQLQALIPRQLEDDTLDKGIRDSSDGSGKKDNGKAASSGSSMVLNKTWFIRLRPDKPPSEPIEVAEEFGLLPPLLR